MKKFSQHNKPPRFEFTKDGYETMKQEFADLQEKRKEAVILLRKAREMGDLSENSAYKVARQKLNSVDGRLTRLTVLLKYAVIVEPAENGVVGLSSKVVVDDGSQKKEFTIVGGYESDLSQGKISSFSPIGKALMGRKIDDIVTIHVPAGKIQYKVIKIS